jgi:hypothetical protein
MSAIWTSRHLKVGPRGVRNGGGTTPSQLASENAILAIHFKFWIKRRNFRSVMKQFGEVRQAVAERTPKRWRRNAARRSGIAIRLNRANGTYSAA